MYNASRKLIYTDQRIIDIAMDCGFESSEAFSRAFKVMFGGSPSEYRRNGLDLVIKAKKELDLKGLRHVSGNISLHPAFVEIPETTIAGIRGRTTLGDNHIPELWGRFFDLYGKDLSTDPLGGYCVCETGQSTYSQDGDACFSIMIGFPVLGFTYSSDGLVIKKIPSGRYAVFTHRGSFENMDQTYRYIFGTWAMNAKEQLDDDREDFELHHKKVTAVHDFNNEVKIYIPIK